MAYERKPDRIYYDRTRQQNMQHEGYATRIYWTPQMLADLRRFYPDTTNEELCSIFRVSHSTLHRKARELGLRKNPAWLKAVWDINRQAAHTANRINGFRCGFRKGTHPSPANEFRKGHVLPPESEAKRIRSYKKWCRLHPGKCAERMLRAWATRRKNNNNNNNTNTPQQ